MADTLLDLPTADRLPDDDAPPVGRRPSPGRRVWSAAWPKVSALVLFLLLWQVVVASGWRPSYLLPGPGAVFRQLGSDLGTGDFWRGVGYTARRALTGYTIAVLLGGVVGIAVARVRALRAAVGSMLTGLQTMPSVAWFPLAILLYQTSEAAILFVVVIGAAPSIANGVLDGVDRIPPVLLRSGRVLGARGLGLVRSVVVPAALPSFVSGLKQGWAFAFRSLMSGELIAIIANHRSLGVRLDQARTNLDAPELLAMMIVILVLGLVVNAAFTAADRTLRRRWGLADA
jgi:NitT/TauT family transport system permease protein